MRALQRRKRRRDGSCLAPYYGRRYGLTDVIEGRDFFQDAMETFQDLFQNIVNEEQGLNNSFLNKVKYPKTDVYEEDGNLVFDVAVPGMKEDQIEVVYEEGVLTVKTVDDYKNESEEDGRIVKELRHSSFQRKWGIPESTIEENKVKCTMKDGILKIKAPLKKVKEEIPQKKTLQINKGE